MNALLGILIFVIGINYLYEASPATAIIVGIIATMYAINDSFN